MDLNDAASPKDAQPIRVGPGLRMKGSEPSDECDHRWHYHDGAKHCFRCRTTVEGVDAPPGGKENEGGFTPYPSSDAAPVKARDALVDEAVNILWKWMHEPKPGSPNNNQAVATGVIMGEVTRLRELLMPPSSDAAQAVAWRWRTKTIAGDEDSWEFRRTKPELSSAEYQVQPLYAHPRPDNEDAPSEITDKMIRDGVCAVTSDTFDHHLTLKDQMDVVRLILRAAWKEG